MACSSFVMLLQCLSVRAAKGPIPLFTVILLSLQGEETGWEFPPHSDPLRNIFVLSVAASVLPLAVVSVKAAFAKNKSCHDNSAPF